ncbi:hypothetical protein NC661_11180 [Aquibacillus koreensis]|uniref:Uncharacterized protein n=1 Tax=Aquibacillus koreensis TaxID=279446 RepID=A0A9X3WP14_9BACI|nr:hypothetical protein [Aquibacillus koreensis]MCT2537722.1 hypothetical protein [Aquibacillus koreensis]MDC3420931.1 hypothetical protein [Aquibacillus koreensis]
MNPKEVLFWSIALPGFGQLLNKKYIKGIILVALEFLINVQGNFNEIIRLSFIGETHLAFQQADLGWLMFYPCLYFFAIWDAYKDAGGAKNSYSFLPFVFCAYTVTVGVMYSSKVFVLGVFLGPVWLPMISVIPGIILGLLVKKVLRKFDGE